MRARRLELLLTTILVLLAVPAVAPAADVTCGDTVDRRTATLSGDCTGSITVIAGTLYLQGFTISGTGLAAIQCQGRCRIEGPGAIVSAGSTYGISGDGSIRAADIIISGHEAAGVDAGALGRVRLDNVAISDCGVGVTGPRAKLTDCQITDNTGSGILITDRGVKLMRSDVLRNGGDGIEVTLSSAEANRASVLYSTVSNNGHFGVIAKNVSSKHSVVRLNSQEDVCGDTEPCSDIAAVNPPRVSGSLCDTSMQVPEEFSGPLPFGVPWGVCALDD